MNSRIGFIGLGNMALAMANRLELCTPAWSISGFGRSGSSKTEVWGKKFSLVASLEDLMACDVIVLAVKPQQLDSLGAVFPKNFSGVVMSVLAGVTCEQIQKTLGVAQVVRMMPSLSVEIGKGVFLVHGDYQKLKATLLSHWGTPWEVPEENFARLTSIVGSALAQLAYLVRAWERHYQIPGTLALEILKAQAEMLGHSSFSSMDDVIAKVSSRGGITEAMITAWDQQGLEKVLEQGWQMAELRGRKI